MEPFAEASCILRMNIDCEACKMKVMEVLSSIIGVYSVDIDGKEGRVKIFGEVDPSTLLKALARTVKHAKLEWAKLNHPLVNKTYHHGSYNYGYTSSSAALEDHPYPSYGSNNYSDCVPTARHVSSYPTPVYDPYQDDSISLCSIM